MDILVKGSLDKYEEIYPFAEQLVRRPLTGSRSYFVYSDLDRMMNEISALRKQAGLSKEEVMRLFTECGVLGLWREEHDLPFPKKTLVEAVFEYQVKGTLTITNRSKCAIHPMFYQELRTEVDMDTFTYPLPAEDEEKEILEEVGIRLGSDL